MASLNFASLAGLLIPAKLRRRFGIAEGSLITAEARQDGILIRPAMMAIIVPAEKFSPAEFLLSSAARPAEYLRTVR